MTKFALLAAAATAQEELTDTRHVAHAATVLTALDDGDGQGDQVERQFVDGEGQGDESKGRMLTAKDRAMWPERQNADGEEQGDDGDGQGDDGDGQGVATVKGRKMTTKNLSRVALWLAC